MSEIWLGALQVVAILALTAGTAICVAAEFSLTALDPSTVETHRAQRGDRAARSVQRAHRTLSFQLSGAQLGITITTLLTGYIAEPAVADLLRPGLVGLHLPEAMVHPLATVLALAIATALSMTFGELVPKNVAIAHPLPTARAVAGIHAAFSRLFRVAINLLNGTANQLVRRLGVEPAEELRSARSPEELRSIVASSAEHGTLDQPTARLLTRSLRFDALSAAEIMTPRVRVETLPPRATVADLLAAARSGGRSRFPICEHGLDDVRGVVHVKQAFGVAPDRRTTTRLVDIAMPLPSVPATMAGDTLLERLRSTGAQVALVVDEYGGAAGLVTLEDLMEEIVGDIRDEHDAAESSPVRQVGEREYRISGLLRRDELAEATGFVVPTGDYDTVAGFVVHELGRIPEVGDEVRTDTGRLVVTRLDRHRADELALTVDEVVLADG